MTSMSGIPQGTAMITKLGLQKKPWTVTASDTVHFDGSNEDEEDE